MADVNRTQMDWVLTGLKQIQDYSAALGVLDAAQRKVNATLGVKTSRTSITTMLDATTKMKQSLTTSATGARSLRTEITKVADSTKVAARETEGLASSLKSIGRIAIGTLISRSMSKAIQAFREGISEAKDFIIAVGEIRTIAQDSQRTFDAWSGSVRRLSDEFGSPLLEVAEANYQTLSNQIAKGTKATGFLRDAQRFALVSVTNLDDAVNLLSGSLNAYGEGADQASRHSAAFFKTIELGRIRGKDIANTFGNVAIVGAQLGVEFEELGAALATLTIQGVAPNVAMTGLRNVMLKLIRPTDAMIARFKEWGVATGEQAIAQFGFVGILRKLAVEAERTGEPLADLGNLFGRLRAIVGATGLVTAFEKFESVLADIKDGTLDFNAALDEMLNNTGIKFRREMQRIANIFTVDFGVEAIGAIVTFSEAIGGLANAVKTLAPAIKVASLALSLQLTAVLIRLIPGVKTATLSLGLLRASFIALINSPAILAAAFAFAGFKIGEVIFQMNDDFDELSEDMTIKFGEESDKRLGIIRKETNEMVDLYAGAVDKQINEVEGLINTLRALYNSLKTEAQKQLALEEDVFRAKQKNASVDQQLFNLQEKANKFVGRTDQSLKAGNIEQAVIFANELEKTSTAIERLAKDNIAAARLQVQLNKRIETIRENIFDLEKKGSGDVTSAAALDLEGEFKKSEAFLGTLKVLQKRISDTAEATANLKKESSELQESLRAQTVQLQENLASPDFAKAIPAPFRSESSNAAIRIEKDLATVNAALEANKEKLIGSIGLTTIKQLIGEIKTDIISIKDAGDDFDILTGVGDSEKILTDMQGAIEAIILAREKMPALINELQSLEEATPNINKVVGEANVKLHEVETNIIAFTELGATQVGVVNEVAKSSSAVMGQLNRDLEQYIKNIDAALLKQSQLKTNKWTGGPITRFAQGGSVGSDTINARLSPGEFVVNKNSARQFFPQLVSANSGAARFNSGGVVTNNNVGDINVTVQGGSSSDATVRQIGNSLRREISRGILRLN